MRKSSVFRMNRPGFRYEDEPPDKRRRTDEKAKKSSSSKPAQEWDFDETDFTDDQLETIEFMSSQAMAESAPSEKEFTKPKPVHQTSKAKGPYPYSNSSSSSATSRLSVVSSVNKPSGLQSSKPNVQTNLAYPLHSKANANRNRPGLGNSSNSSGRSSSSTGALSLSQQSRTGEDFNHNKVTSHRNSKTFSDSQAGSRQTNAPGWSQSSSVKNEGSNSTDRFMEGLKQQVEKLKEENESIKKQMQDVKEEKYSKDGQIKMLRESLSQKESELFKQQKDRSKAIEEKVHEYVEKEKAHVAKERGLLQEIEKLKAAVQFKEHEIAEANANCKKLEQKTSSSPVVCSQSQRSPRNAKRPVPSDSTSPISSKTAKGAFPTRQTFMAAESMNRGKSTPPPVMSLRNALRAEKSPVRSATGSPVSRSGERSERSRQLKMFSVKISNHKGSINGSNLMARLIDNHGAKAQTDLIGLLNSGCWTTPCNKPAEGATQHQHRPRLRSQSCVEEKEENQHEAVCCQLARSGINKLLSHSHHHDSSGILASRTPGVHELLPVIETSLRNFINYQTLLESGVKLPGSTNSSKSLSCEGSLDSVNASMKNLDISSPVPVPTVTETALTILYKLVCYSEDVRSFLLSSDDDIACREGVGSCGDCADRRGIPLQNQADIKNKSDGAGDGRHTASLLDILFQLACPYVIDEKAVHVEITEKVLQVLTVLANLGNRVNTDRLSVLLMKCVPMKCLALSSHSALILRCMELLEALSISSKLIASFCRQTESCVFLEVYNICLGTFPEWSREDRTSFCGKVVNLLWTVVDHHKGGIAQLLESDCNCSVEVVKAVVVMLNNEMEHYKHCQWSQSFQVIRRGVGLIHIFCLRDQQFSEHWAECELQYTSFLSSMSVIVKQMDNPDDNMSMAVQDLWDLDDSFQEDEEEENHEASMETS